MTDERGQLPRPLRYFILATLTLGTLVSWKSWQETVEAAIADSVELVEPTFAGLDGGALDAKVMQAMFKAGQEARLSAIRSMRAPRIAVLVLLSFAALLTATLSLRVRWPGMARREDAAAVVGWGALVAAIARAMDGGQQLVIAQRSAGAMVKAAAEQASGELTEAFSVAQRLMAAFTIAHTLAILVGFFVVWRVFSAERTRGLLRRLDGPV